MLRLRTVFNKPFHGEVTESWILFLIYLFFVECSLRFTDDHSQTTLFSFDLNESGKAKIEISEVPSGAQHKLLNCMVTKVRQMSSNGFEFISNHTFDTGKTVNWKSKTFSLTVSRRLCTL